MRRARERLDEHRRQHAVVDAVTLLRLAGEGEVDAGECSARSWTGELLAGLPDERLVEEHEAAGFAGELRPYQRRGLGWLRFLDRLGLGGCLADDMGLGKTATTLAHLLDRPGPHLVVCPLSVVHNWEHESARFTPSLRVLVHHGAERTRELAGADLVITTYGLLPRDLEHLGAVRLVHGRRRRGADDQEPGDARGEGVAGPDRGPEAGAHRHAGREPPRRPLGHPRRRQPRHARQPRALPSSLRQADRARRRRRRGGPAAPHHPAVRAAPHQGRPPARTRPPRQDRAGRLGRAHARAGRALPARRRPVARRRRRRHGHEAAGPRARRAHPAQADLQPPGARPRRRITAGRALRQAGALRRARRRAARRRRAGARVHPVP